METAACSPDKAVWLTFSISSILCLGSQALCPGHGSERPPLTHQPRPPPRPDPSPWELRSQAGRLKSGKSMHPTKATGDWGHGL